MTQIIWESIYVKSQEREKAYLCICGRMAAFGSKPNITFRDFTEEKKSSPWPAKKCLSIRLCGKVVPLPLHVHGTLCCVCSYRKTQFIIIGGLENGTEGGRAAPEVKEG